MCKMRKSCSDAVRARGAESGHLRSLPCASRLSHEIRAAKHGRECGQVIANALENALTRRRATVACARIV